MNTKGFTLVEIMIAMAVTSYLAIMVFELKKEQSEMMNQAEAKQFAQAITQEISRHLAFEQNCTPNFVNLPIAGQDIDSLNITIPTPMSYDNTHRFFNNLTFEKIILISDLNSPASIANHYYGQFIITFKKGGHEFNKRIPARVEVDSSNMILKCQSMSEPNHKATHYFQKPFPILTGAYHYSLGMNANYNVSLQQNPNSHYTQPVQRLGQTTYKNWTTVDLPPADPDYIPAGVTHLLIKIVCRNVFVFTTYEGDPSAAYPLPLPSGASAADPSPTSSYEQFYGDIWQRPDLLSCSSWQIDTRRIKTFILPVSMDRKFTIMTVRGQDSDPINTPDTQNDWTYAIWVEGYVK